ncbi:hypothetical protein [Oceanobacter mangrovi]|uniref:hypothetical protein n=1 Tax=Oceanobacter mangrovi TaxID=2862510 RepID=UPI001C8E6022|nr:hypothetical protein [Oceanobacter mangrovi]
MNTSIRRAAVLLVLGLTIVPTSQADTEPDGIGGTGLKTPIHGGDEEGIGGTGKGPAQPERPEVFERPDLFDIHDMVRPGIDTSTPASNDDATGSNDAGQPDTPSSGNQ